jgi:hypothetical protein
MRSTDARLTNVNPTSAGPSGQPSFTAVPETLTISMLLPTVS